MLALLNSIPRSYLKHRYVKSKLSPGMLGGWLAFFSCHIDSLFDLIFLDVASMRENDQFAYQTDCEKLDTEHDK